MPNQLCTRIRRLRILFCWQVFHGAGETPGTIFGFWSSFWLLEQFLAFGAGF
jgi:hypothetical protein